MINLKIDPEFQNQIPPLTDDEYKQLEENILKEGKLLSPLIVWNNTLVDGHNRYEIVQEHPEISFSTMPLPFESREEVLSWICKNQLGRRNLTPEQKKFLIGKQYSVEHRKPGGNGNNQHTAAAKKTAPEELCQIDTIPPQQFMRVKLQNNARHIPRIFPEIPAAYPDHYTSHGWTSEIRYSRMERREKGTLP